MDNFLRLPLSLIRVRRDERQRRIVDPSDIIESVRKRGVLSPIIVEREPCALAHATGSFTICSECQNTNFLFWLIAGERRLEASRQCGLPDIPVRFFEDLSRIEVQIIELEENLRRKDLPWQDFVRALEKIHNLYCVGDGEWSQNSTAEALGLSAGTVSEHLRVAKDLHEERIANATSTRTAYNMLVRADDRVVADVLSDIIASSKAQVKAAVEPKAHPSPSEGGSEPSPAPTPPPLSPFPDSLVQGDFLRWAGEYDDLPFNFIHCDFPYGINVFGGAWSGRGEWQTYDDHPDIYWELCAGLCSNLDRVMSHSAHLMFWCSANSKIIHNTLEFFRKEAPTLAFNPTPLVWLKSDNVGIMPDPSRGPRQVYEVALMASREDRLIVKPVANAYSAPTNKELHPHTKPVPVLKHFFQMFVDQNTRLLDPTCGSGASLRAGEELGAEKVFGLELDAGVAEASAKALRNFRILRRM